MYMLVYAGVCIGVTGLALVSAWEWRPEVQAECLVRSLLQSSSRSIMLSAE